MQRRYSDELLYLVSRLYYVDGLGQGDVARFVQVSQAKISRLLSLARERGIVRISVAEYDPRAKELEATLKKRYGLDKVFVIKATEGMDQENLRRALGHFGGSLLASLIGHGDIVALAGGRTIYEVVHRLPQDENRAITVVQTMGSIDSSISKYDAQEVGRILAKQLGGQYYSLNAPAFMPSGAARDSLLEHEQVKRVMERVNNANIAIVGVGTFEDSLVSQPGVLKPQDIEILKNAGAIGEICGRFFDERGQECASPLRDRVVGVELDQLRRIPQVIGVVSGKHRAEAIRAAINGNLLKSIIIDEEAAHSLLL